MLSIGRAEQENISSTSLTGSFTVEGVQVCVPAAGQGNIENALAALAICRQFGLSVKVFAESLETFSPVSMRLEPMNIGSITVLNDCYNANPASMKNALDCLAQLGSTRDKRLVFVCGPMLELGEQAEKLHAELGTAAAKAGVKLLLASGEFGQITTVTAQKSTKCNMQAEWFADTAKLCDNIYKFMKPDDIILVKGSRAAKLETIVEKLKELFG